MTAMSEPGWAVHHPGIGAIPYRDQAEATAAAGTAGTVHRTWTIAMPTPAPWLNANGRTDRRAQTPDRRAWRDAAHVWARKVHLPKLQRALIIVELRFTDRRRRDPHNYFPTIKAVVDGLVDYGLLPDDSSRHLIGPDVRMGAPLADERVGQLVLTIHDYDPKEACRPAVGFTSQIAVRR